jgi:hypothetical protein
MNIFNPKELAVKKPSVSVEEKNANYSDSDILIFEKELQDCLRDLPLSELELVISEEYMRRMLVVYDLYESCNVPVNTEINHGVSKSITQCEGSLNQLGVAKNWIADKVILPGMKVFLSYVMCLNTEFTGEGSSVWSQELLRKTEKIVFKAIENLFKFIKISQYLYHDKHEDISETYSPKDEEYLDKLFLKVWKEVEKRKILLNVLRPQILDFSESDIKNNNNNLPSKSLEDLRKHLDEKMSNLCQFYSKENISIKLENTEFYSNIFVYRLTYGETIKNIVVFVHKYKQEDSWEKSMFGGVTFDLYSSDIIVLEVSEMFFLNGDDEIMLPHEFAHIIDVLKSGKGASAKKSLLTEVPAIFAERVSKTSKQNPLNHCSNKRIDYTDFFKQLLALNVLKISDNNILDILIQDVDQAKCASLKSFIKKVQSESIKALDADLIKSIQFAKMQYSIGGLIVDYLTIQKNLKTENITLDNILNYIQEGSLETLLDSLNISIDELTIFIADRLSIIETKK